MTGVGINCLEKAWEWNKNGLKEYGKWIRT